METSLSLEEKLKRLIYLNSVNPQFFVGNPDEFQPIICPEKLSATNEAIQNDLKELFAILDAANKDNNLPRRSIMFMTLARLMKQEIKPELKSKITAKVFELIRTDEDYFNFIKYYTQHKEKCKMPSSVQKLVRKYYTSKTSLEIAQSASRINRMHGWSHKDLIKLAHVKSDSPLKNVVINYILTRKVSDKASDEELEVLNILRKSDELRRTKESVDAVPILVIYKLSIDQVLPSLHQKEEVWSAAIQNMSLQEILPRLEKLYKLGLLKVKTTITNHLIHLFTNAEKIKASGVHPIEVFTYLKRLEKGGKPMDMKLFNYLQNEKKLPEADLKKAQTRTEAKCTHILNALWKCFDLACNNVTPTNKRYLVSVDVTAEAKKSVCLGNKVVTLLEAAVAYTIVLLRTEKDVMLATYHDEKMEFLKVEKKVSFVDLLKKVNKQTSTYSWLYSPVEWAASEKKHVDVFVNFIHNEFSGKLPKEKSRIKTRCEPIVKYRSKINLPNSKFLTFAPVKKCMPLFVDTPPNFLDILGFDTVACKVAECFSRGAFC